LLQFPADVSLAVPKPDNKNIAFVATALDAADITAAGIPYHSAGASNTFTVGFPDFADVMLRVLTDEGARIIEAYENGRSVAPPNPSGSGQTAAQWQKSYWWTLALEHSQVFVERIPIASRPL
jgi:hypothetical protein